MSTFLHLDSSRELFCTFVQACLNRSRRFAIILHLPVCLLTSLRYCNHNCWKRCITTVPSVLSKYHSSRGQPVHTAQFSCDQSTIVSADVAFTSLTHDSSPTASAAAHFVSPAIDESGQCLLASEKSRSIY